MAQITAITPQVKDKERVNVYVDGRFYCGMRLETVMANRLKVGNEIAPEKLDAIQEENERAQALDKAMTHLSATMKTEKQMRDFLKKKGYVDGVCDYVLEKLREYRFVDDEQYCAQYAESASKNMGARRIAMELKQRGADEAAIEQALSGLAGQSDAAKSVAEKYMRGREFTKENLSKTFRYLMGRGFDYETAKDALASLGADTDEE